MATDDANHPNVKTLSVNEAQALADRVYSRSVSRLFDAQPELQRDCCMASRVIRSLLHDVDRLASQCEDTARILRNLQIDVGGC